MHVENELVEIVTTSDHEYEKVIEEYEEEILMQEEVLELSPTDLADAAVSAVAHRRARRVHTASPA